MGCLTCRHAAGPPGVPCANRNPAVVLLAWCYAGLQLTAFRVSAIQLAAVLAL
jgi:hypothetical protein